MSSVCLVTEPYNFEAVEGHRRAFESAGRDSKEELETLARIINGGFKVSAPLVAPVESLYCDLKGVAKILGLSPHTVKDWYLHGTNGFPEPHHFGRRVMWKISDIKEWAEAQRVKPSLHKTRVLSIKNAATFQAGRTYEN